MSTKKVHPLLRAAQDQNAVVENYSKTRARFNNPQQQNASKPITDSHGFYVGNNGNLTERVAGLDKLFYTLVQGIVEDPDFAVRKDPQIYDRMMRDPQIFYCLMVRKAAVSSLSWTIAPKSALAHDEKAVKIAQDCERRIRQIPRFSELLDNMMDALLPGMSLNELVWKVGPKGAYLVKQHFPVSKDRIKFDKDGDIRLLSPNAPTTGRAVPPYKFIHHVYNTTDGSWARPETAGYAFYGRGLADTPLYHYFHFKMIALKFYMKEMERFGMPFKVLYTGPQNAALSEKIYDIMLALKNDAVVTIPGKKGDVNVDVAKLPPSKNLFSTFIEYVDGLTTKAILGQELMTEVPATGSYAAASVHRTVFGLLNTKDKMQIADSLDRSLIRYDAQLNTPEIPEEYIPEFQFKKSALEQSGEFLKTVQMALELGLAVSEAQVREYTGLREPADNERTVSPQQNGIPELQDMQNNGEMQKAGNMEGGEGAEKMRKTQKGVQNGRTNEAEDIRNAVP